MRRPASAEPAARKKKLVVSGDCGMGWCHVGALVGVIG